MGLLSAILPGVRQVRTPLAAGAVWLTFVYLLVTVNAGWLAENAPGLITLAASGTQVAGVYLLGALAFVAYIIGVVTLEPSRWLSICFSKLAGWARQRIRPARATPFQAAIAEALKKRFASAGLNVDTVLTFPTARVLDSLEDTAFQLWHRALDQYQEYDRLQSETRFRRTLWLPLVAVGVMLWIIVAWWLSIALFLAALMLLWQVRGIEFERRSLLVAAFSDGLVDVPIVDGTIRELRRMSVPRKIGFPSTTAAVAVALERIGRWKDSEAAVWRAVVELSEEVDFSESDWKRQIRSQAMSVRRVLKRNGAVSLLEEFDGYLAFGIETVAPLIKGSADSKIDRTARVVWRELPLTHVRSSIERLTELSKSHE